MLVTLACSVKDCHDWLRSMTGHPKGGAVNEERWYSVEDISGMLGVHGQTVRRWLRGGELGGILLGRKAGYRISERDFEAFVASRRRVEGDPEGESQGDESKKLAA